MARLSEVRIRTTELLEGETPYEIVRRDRSFVILKFIVPDQSYARGSMIRIRSTSNGEYLHGECLWSVEDAVERSRRFRAGELTELLAGLQTHQELSSQAKYSAMTASLAVAMSALASALHEDASVVIPLHPIPVPIEGMLRVTVEGDLENRPIRFRLICTSTKGIRS